MAPGPGVWIFEKQYKTLYMFLSLLYFTVHVLLHYFDRRSTEVNEVSPLQCVGIWSRWENESVLFQSVLRFTFSIYFGFTSSSAVAPRRSWLWCKSPLYVEGLCKPSLSSEMGSEPFTACHLWTSRDLFPNCCDGVCAILRSGVSATQFEILFMKSSRWQSTSNIGCCQRERTET